MTLLDRARAAFSAQKQAYAAEAEDERPLEGYALAMGAFSVVTAAVAALSAARGEDRPVQPRDVVLLGVASHKLARIASKDAVSSPLRAPFTTYKGPAGPGEVTEEVRGTGVRHAVGELLTCPYCISPWVATLLLGGHAVAPRLARQVTTVFAAVAVADILQAAYGVLEKKAE